MKRDRELRIGISGWTYAGWRGEFYPKGLVHKRELEYASRMMNSIEVNGSFYSLQRPSSYERWYNETPEDFIFAVKGSRFVTHMKKLNDARTPLANFFASGILRLGEKLGPILWQFPANFGFDQERFESFLSLLPSTTLEAAKLAHKHDHRLSGRSWMDVRLGRPLRHAFEVRHESFLVPEFARLLRRYNVALVVADSAGTWPLIEEMTADFVYIRLHGAGKLYEGRYSGKMLDEWARRIRLWRSGRQPGDAARISDDRTTHASGRDVYVYFDNDVKVAAPRNAMQLAEKIEG